MKVVILAGGYGTRLSEYTDIIPKPMLRIGEKPMLWHIMKWYAKFGYKDFYIALGYKSEYIKDFFLNYSILSSTFTVNLSNGSVNIHKSADVEDWNVTLVDTGEDSLTGGRLKRMAPYLEKDESFMLTYGDGLSNINIRELVEFHNSTGKEVTVSAVRPTARFGELSINDDSSVEHFIEKPHASQGWINGGFFVMNTSFLRLIKDDTTVLEKEPLEQAAASNELSAFRHEGFWQCVDTKRDLDYLNKIWAEGKAEWSVK